VERKSPREGVYKVNWDDVVDMINQRIGVSIIVQDNKGNVIAEEVLPNLFMLKQ
jgi:hypothetical protein